MHPGSTSTAQTNDEEMLLDQPYTGIVSGPGESVTTPQPGGDAKVKFVSQQQTRTSSGATNITRTSSSTTALSRTTSGTTNPPSRAVSNTTDITDFSSQGVSTRKAAKVMRMQTERSVRSVIARAAPRKLISHPRRRPTSDVVESSVRDSKVV
jgi:hypothetical protein